jgi:PAS domain S-box-containing protein
VPATSIGEYLIPPTFAHEGRTLAARKVWGALVGSLIVFTTLMLIEVVVVPASAGRAFGFMAVNAVLMTLLLWMTRRGWVQTASVLALIVFAAIFMAAAWTAGGVRAPAMMGFLVIVGMAGILQGVTGIIFATTVSVLLTLLLYDAERAGRLPPPSIHHTSFSIWLTLAAAMVELACVQLIAAWVTSDTERKAKALAAERERIDQARHETEAKFVTVFESSPDAIVITDLHSGEVIEANPGYVKLYGHSREEMIGRTTVELGIFGESGGRQKLLDSLRETGTVRDQEMNSYDRAGNLIPCLFSGQTVMLGDRLCLVSIVHDLTRRKQAEKREQAARDDFTRKLFSSQEMERRRIAGELHDSLGQNLILIKNRAQMGLSMAVTIQSAAEQFRDLSEMASEAIAEVRQISHDLRPHHLDQLGLTRALESMFDGASQSSLLSIQRRLDPVDDLFTADEASHLYRVAQETLSNILKHSKARTAKIGLERDLHDVRLWIEDDGEGFLAPGSNSPLPTGGLGLSSITERVRILKGSLEITSLPGKGTRIDIVIPRSSETG